MPNIAHNTSRKDSVGGPDFDRSKVDNELAKNEGKDVNVYMTVDKIQFISTHTTVIIAGRPAGMTDSTSSLKRRHDDCHVRTAPLTRLQPRVFTSISDML